MWSAFRGHRNPFIIIQNVLLTRSSSGSVQCQRPISTSSSSVFLTSWRHQNRRQFNSNGHSVIPPGAIFTNEMKPVEQYFKRNVSSCSHIRNGNGSLVIPNNLKVLVKTTCPKWIGGSCGVHSRSDDGPYLPPLMEMPFPPRTWPRLIYSIRNWFFIYFVIRPYMDKDFDIQEFNRGAKQAVAFVSEKLVSGEYDDLEGVVEPQALSQMKTAVASFTVFQRNLLKVVVDDIFFSFPYQIGIMIPDPVRQEGDKILPQTRHVEITVVFHILRGFAEQAKTGGDAKTFQDFVKADDTKYNVMICNYRFFKDFTEGTKDPIWIINLVNHFLPADKNHY